MQIQFDRDVDALYIEIAPGDVEATIELTDTIYVDVDQEGNPLGVEFLDADEFPRFLRQEPGDVDVDLAFQVREALSVRTNH